MKERTCINRFGFRHTGDVGLGVRALTHFVDSCHTHLVMLSFLQSADRHAVSGITTLRLHLIRYCTAQQRTSSSFFTTFVLHSPTTKKFYCSILHIPNAVLFHLSIIILNLLIKILVRSSHVALRRNAIDIYQQRTHQ